MIYKKGEKMTYDEAIKVLRKEKWKASPNTPLPSWLIEKSTTNNDPNAIKDFRKVNDLKYEALDIAIDCIKIVKSLSRLKGKTEVEDDAEEED